MNKEKNKPEEPKAAPMYQNQVRLVGFLGADPLQHENRAIFSLATKNSWKAQDSEEWQHHTEWHRCVAWGKLADAVKPLAKGDHVLVEGELRSYEYAPKIEIEGKTYVSKGRTLAWEIRVRAVRKLVRKRSLPRNQPRL